MSISVHSVQSAQSHDSTTSDALNVHEKEHHGDKAVANVLDLYFLGITIVIGGQVFSWNEGLVEGFWEYFACVMFTGSGYLCLILCLSEMASALPFSGGAYGYVRATIGPFFGYLVGCCEAIQNIVYVSVSVIPFAQMCTLAFRVPSDYEPIYWVFFFVTAIYINNSGGKLFWRFSTIIGLVSLLLIVVYILGTIPQMDFEAHSEQRVYPKDGGKFIEKIMQALPVASWFYIGVESIPLACIDCASPKHDLPRAMVACICTLLVTAICVYFSTCSQAPGLPLLSEELLPLNTGYSASLNIPYYAATYLALPSTYATGFGFMFIYGRQISSMARSGLLPKFLAPPRPRKKNGRGAKYVKDDAEEDGVEGGESGESEDKVNNHNSSTGLYLGSFLALLIILIVYYAVPNFVPDLFLICLLGSYFNYICTFISYYFMATKFSSLDRGFHSPFGIYGAFWGFFVFLVGVISILGFQGDDASPIIVYSVYIIFMSILYFAFIRKRQKFSVDEQKTFFSAYVINANMRHKKKGKRGFLERGYSMNSSFGARSSTSNTGAQHGGKRHSASSNASRDSKLQSSAGAAGGVRADTVTATATVVDGESNQVTANTVVASPPPSVLSSLSTKAKEVHSTSSMSGKFEGNTREKPRALNLKTESSDRSPVVPLGTGGSFSLLSVSQRLVSAVRRVSTSAISRVVPSATVLLEDEQFDAMSEAVVTQLAAQSKERLEEARRLLGAEALALDQPSGGPLTEEELLAALTQARENVLCTTEGHGLVPEATANMDLLGQEDDEVFVASQPQPQP